jgi:DNA-binding response OmpR family regulator
MKLLLVEDEDRLAEALSHLLKKNGYVVDTTADGETGTELAATGVYDVIVLDRMLPGRDGLSLLKEIRGLRVDTPVLFLTAKDAPTDRVEGLNAGADDYLVKPFFTDELLARLRALTRRKGKDLVNDTVDVAGLIFSPLRCEVIKGDQVIQLTAKEALLFDLLIRNYGCVITKERIMEKIWGYNSEAELANVDLYIHYLRKKLQVSSIKTVRGVGYYLQEDKNVSAATP